LAREALALRGKIFGEDHAESLMSMHLLAGILDLQGRHLEAEPMLRAVVDKAESLPSADAIREGRTNAHSPAFV
jgi:hypothetical protein